MKEIQRGLPRLVAIPAVHPCAVRARLHASTRPLDARKAWSQHRLGYALFGLCQALHAIVFFPALFFDGVSPGQGKSVCANVDRIARRGRQGETDAKERF